MLIQLNEQYRVRGVAMNFVLEEKKVRGDKSKNAGEEYWEEIGFYPSLDALLRGMFKRHLQASECVGVIEVIQEINKAVATIQAQMRSLQDE